MFGPHIVSPTPQRYNPTRLFTPPLSPQPPTSQPFEQKNHSYFQALQNLIQSLYQSSNPTQIPSIEQLFTMFKQQKEMLSADELLLTLFVFHFASCIHVVSPDEPDFFTRALIESYYCVVHEQFDVSTLYSERSWTRVLARAQNVQNALAFCQSVTHSSFPIMQIFDPLHPQDLTNRTRIQNWHALCYWLTRVIPVHQEYKSKYILSYHKWLQKTETPMSSQAIIDSASCLDYFCLVFNPASNLRQYFTDTPSQVINTLSLQQWQQKPIAHETAIATCVYAKNTQITLEIIKTLFLHNQTPCDLVWIRRLDGHYKKALLWVIKKEQIPHTFRVQLAHELLQAQFLSLLEKLEYVEKVLKTTNPVLFQVPHVLQLLQVLFQLHSEIYNKDTKEKIYSLCEMLVQSPWNYNDQMVETYDLVNEHLVSTAFPFQVRVACVSKIESQSQRIQELQDKIYINLMHAYYFYAYQIKQSYPQSRSMELVTKKNCVLEQIFCLYTKIIDPQNKETARKLINEISSLNCSLNCSRILGEMRLYKIFDTLTIENAPLWIRPIIDEINSCVCSTGHVQSYLL